MFLKNLKLLEYCTSQTFIGSSIIPKTSSFLQHQSTKHVINDMKRKQGGAGKRSFLTQSHFLFSSEQVVASEKNINSEKIIENAHNKAKIDSFSQPMASEADPNRENEKQVEVEVQDIPAAENTGGSGVSQMRRAIFPSVWSRLVHDFGEEHMVFPKEVVWLMGAPGSGKGTHCEFICHSRGFTAEPLVISSILNSPEAAKVKAEGGLLDDATVLSLLLRQLLRPSYKNGVVVDGFPRTPAQAEAIRMLRDKMFSLRRKFFDNTDLVQRFRPPSFRVIVLFVDESTSVKRQMARGQQTIKHNKLVAKKAKGKKIELRPTDKDPELARARYAIFMQHHATLESLRKAFTFSFIDASNDIEEVRKEILKEVAYQSAHELQPETFDSIMVIPVLRELQQYARQMITQRLDEYQTHHLLLFSTVISFIEKEIVPLLKQHVFAGETIFKTSDPVFLNKRALQMLVDVLTERGYQVHYTCTDTQVPERVDLQTGEITNRLTRTWEIHISWRSLKLRGRLDPSEMLQDITNDN